MLELWNGMKKQYNPNVDYYETLQVDPSADNEVIKTAYRILARKYHPDGKAPEKSEELTKRMAQINDAYACLGNPKIRTEYDAARAALRQEASQSSPRTSPPSHGGSSSSPHRTSARPPNASSSQYTSPHGRSNTPPHEKPSSSSRRTSPKSSVPTYYEILQVDPNADFQTIRTAYRNLALKYHPDNNDPRLSEELNAKMRQINEAYSTLRDPVKRAKYDAMGTSWQGSSTHWRAETPPKRQSSSSSRRSPRKATNPPPPEESPEIRALKDQLLRQLRVPDYQIALRALEELRSHGWLRDGTLREASLEGVNLQKADLSGANLQGANLFAANLQDAYLREAILQRALLQKANLQHANLEGAMLQEAILSEANLLKTVLYKANLYKADLQGASFDSADLQSVNLTATNLQWSSLRKANLQGIDGRKAVFVKADMREANLERANLGGANLQGANLSSTILHDASLTRTNLTQVVGITDEQLAQVYNLRHATMPDGKRYNGCFNLLGDVQSAAYGRRQPDSQGMAKWYDVSLEDYRIGQKWARKNLRRLRGE